MGSHSKRHVPRLGAHMSIGGGMPRSVERARSVEATALQVFVKSSRQWAAKPIDPDEARRFRDELGQAGLADHTLAHSTYLINLASPDAPMWKKSVDALAVELERCARLGISQLVLHPGSHVGRGEEAGLQRVARALRELLDGSRPSNAAVTVLLEVTAGQGTNLGHRFEHIGWLLENAGVGERLGVCFDTCHALAAGYDFRDADGYGRTFDELDRVIGLRHLRAFHLNDSKFGPGSRKDRHEHIGRGHVGLEAFRLLLNDARFRDLPMVLETPKGDDLAEDRRNLAVLRGLVGEERG